jgi:hypothetical protein
MHNMVPRLLQPTALLQPITPLQRITLLKRIRLLKGTAAEPIVELTVELPVKPTAVPPTPRALVRRLIASPRKPMPLKALARGNGTPVPGQRNAATCASPTLTSIAVTASKRRARPRSAELNKGREVFSRWRREALRPERETGGIPCAANFCGCRVADRAARAASVRA